MDCPNCKTELKNDHKCTFCKFPINGDKQELAVFYARESIDKIEVESASKNIRIARGVLVFLAILNILITFHPSISPLPIEAKLMFYVNCTLFLGFFGLSFKFTFISFLIPLVYLILTYLVDAIMSLATIMQGIWLKVFILASLGYGAFRVYQAKRILNSNPYLASLTKEK